MESKVLILLSDTDDWFSWSMEDSGLVSVDRIYKEMPSRKRQIFKLYNHLPVTLRNSSLACWYGSWKDNLTDFDTIIMFDSFENTDVIKFIKSIHPQARMIVYYNNPIHNESLLQSVKQEDCEIWSFDLEDCHKYGLQHNPQFYFKQLSFRDEIIPQKDYTSDVFFVGKDKNRLSLLMDLYTDLHQKKIKTKFIVVKDKHKKYTDKQRRFLGQPISYRQCIEYVKNCNCVLDIVQNGQVGMTRRVMEAMFFNKKLITNDIAIENMSFFDKQNVFVLNEENKYGLDAFIKKNEAQWNPKLIEYYDFKQWITRFVK